jgi:hypothetical protein
MPLGVNCVLLTPSSMSVVGKSRALSSVMGMPHMSSCLIGLERSVARKSGTSVDDIGWSNSSGIRMLRDSMYIEAGWWRRNFKIAFPEMEPQFPKYKWWRRDCGFMERRPKESSWVELKSYY